ncbi:MAG: PAS domain S-box protein [Verrucomicrobiales bacterium]|nr:PAS domain S-box protein [Verrucomicrobiales bacterium]
MNPPSMVLNRKPGEADSGQDSGRLERRVLLLAPFANEAELAARWLTEAGMLPYVCGNAAQLIEESRRGCGVILLSAEVLEGGSCPGLGDLLAGQPAWSDIPLALLTLSSRSTAARGRYSAILGTGQISLLDRPLTAEALVSTVEVALRARQRQYQARDSITAMQTLLRQEEDRARLFEATLASITDLAYTFDLEGNWIYANQPLLKLWGKSLEEITGKSSLELGYDPELAWRLKAQVQQVIATRKPVRGETYFTSASGEEDYHEYIFSPVFAPDGRVAAVTGTTRLTTERKRAEAVAESQRRVLQLIAEDHPLGEILESLARAVELECTHPAFVCIHLLDSDGACLKEAAAPSLPAPVRAALDGMPIGPAAGSCGAAAFLQKTVQVEEIASDPRLACLRAVALDHGLRACWSRPILSNQGSVLGTVGIYYPECRPPGELDVRLGEMASRTAAIAIARKLGDAAIRESQQRYSQLVHALPTAVYTTDAQGYILLFNEAAAVLWGRRPEVGRDQWCGSWRTYAPDGTPLPADRLPMARALREGHGIRGGEIIIERPDGTRRSVVPYPDPIRDVAGRVIGAVNMLMDITESKSGEEASRRLAAIVESSDDAIISKDLNGLITSWNRGAERLFGYSAQEIIGKPITTLMLPEHSQEEPNILRRIRRGERIANYDTVRRRKNGSLVEISLTISPIKDAHGRIVGASKIVRDITEQKQSERKLEQAHQEAVAASRAKDDFLAALSHELRTPLNPVLLLASEGADDPELPAGVRARFQTIRNNVELEARLIDDLLDITRITHGKLSMNLEMVNVHSALNEAIATVQSEVDLKRIALTTHLSASAPFVEGDAVRLQQVFWNVIKNAVKFTPEFGTVSISTHSEEPDSLSIVISDTGIGMTERELAQAFDAFTQGEHLNAAGAHRFGGLGLGLAIGRKLVELHSGTISARSAGRGKGATFTINLPIRRKTSSGSVNSSENVPASGTPAPTGTGGPRLLLVEDHAATRDALRQLLTRRHYEVQSASSVAEARRLAEQHEFHLLISDIDLPDGTGCDLMREILHRNPDVKGIALSGYGMESDLSKSKLAGFSIHLIKPVRMQSLEQALAQLASTPARNQGPVEKTAPRPAD